MEVGNTPLVQLERLPGSASAEVFVKWEGANPTGSMKDRMALSMIEAAEGRGELRAGYSVVEYTGGSTGSSLAMVCAAKGYRAHFVSSDAFAEEKLQTMRAFGAEVEVIPSIDRQVTPGLIQAIVERARALAAEPDTFWTDQFNNVDNRNGYHALGEEIRTILGDTVSVFVQGVGTAGSFSGTAEVLKRHNPKTLCVAVEPAKSRALSGVPPYGGHRLEGMGPGFKPKIYREDLADEIAAATDEEAYGMARELARTEGLSAGISSGANVCVALHLARRLGRGHRVVTILCDSGLKYLHDHLYGPA
ncbi:MAG TPA: cysteine synthase family protein [Acidimicrobiia bacterium]|nr:cysteine synthase family protein [Acidimicrobiia bacterium]